MGVMYSLVCSDDDYIIILPISCQGDLSQETQVKGLDVGVLPKNTESQGVIHREDGDRRLGAETVFASYPCLRLYGNIM